MSAGTRLPGSPAPMAVWAGADGLRIAGDCWGNPADPLVLLLHGGGQTRHAWRATGKRLASEGHRAVALDLRGHGDSEWAADGDYSLTSYARDLNCILSDMPPGPPVLIGASLGGIVALTAIGEGLVDARALVLVDIVPHVDPAGPSRVRAFMEQGQDGFESLEAVAEEISRYRPEARRPRNLQGLAKNVRLGADNRYRWHWDPRFLEPADMRRAARAERLAEYARRLKVPVLLVRGDESEMVSETGVRKFREVCPGAVHVNVPGAGHMVTGDHNDVFADAVIAFLSRLAESQGDRVRRTGL